MSTLKVVTIKRCGAMSHIAKELKTLMLLMGGAEYLQQNE